MNTQIKTTMVAYIVSFREGHVTFFSSIRTSLRNCLIASNLLIFVFPDVRV